MAKIRSNPLLWIALLFTTLSEAAADSGEETPIPRKKRRNLSLISNILNDLGFDETQKAAACLVLLIVVLGGRFAFGSKSHPFISTRNSTAKVNAVVLIYRYTGPLLPRPSPRADKKASDRRAAASAMYAAAGKKGD